MCADAVDWLRARGRIPACSVVTSLPDVSEVGMKLDAWRGWFLAVVKLVVGVVDDEQCAVFFQTDIKKDGRWIDKGSLVVCAAEDAGAHVLFHKIVCRRPPGNLTYGRPGYTHLIAVSKAARAPAVLPFPDVVVDAGRLTWRRAMGVRACAEAVRFVKDAMPQSPTPTSPGLTILDPFCGVGTVPAVANALGLDAIGVELSSKRCTRARALVVTPADIARAPLAPPTPDPPTPTPAPTPPPTTPPTTPG